MVICAASNESIAIRLGTHSADGQPIRARPALRILRCLQKHIPDGLPEPIPNDVVREWPAVIQWDGLDIVHGGWHSYSEKFVRVPCIHCKDRHNFIAALRQIGVYLNVNRVSFYLMPMASSLYGYEHVARVPDGRIDGAALPKPPDMLFRQILAGAGLTTIEAPMRNQYELRTKWNAVFVPNGHQYEFEEEFVRVTVSGRRESEILEALLRHIAQVLNVTRITCCRQPIQGGIDIPLLNRMRSDVLITNQ